MKENEIFHKEFYELGKLDGIEKANNTSYENGFRKGVELGIELGINQGFINTIKNILLTSMNNNNSLSEKNDKISKLLKKLNTTDNDNLDELKNKIKFVRTNLFLIYKNTNKEIK